MRVEVKTFTEDTADTISLRDVMTRYADRARLSVLFHAESAVGSYRRARVLTDLYVQDDAHSFVSTLERYRNRYRILSRTEKRDGTRPAAITGGRGRVHLDGRYRRVRRAGISGAGRPAGGQRHTRRPVRRGQR